MALSFTEILKVIFLGIVEGVTEWLPISSTGHMLLVDEFLTLNVSDDPGGGDPVLAEDVPLPVQG